MSEMFQVVQTISIPRTFVITTLIDMDRHHHSEKAVINSAENPSVLRGWYNVEIVWEDFWRCWDEVIVAPAAFAVERYADFKISPNDLIKKAVDAYHKTDRFQNCLIAIKDARKAKEEADKAEELRIRQDVPAITLKYDALLIAFAQMERKAKAYESYARNLCGKINDIDEVIQEAKWAPKYHKEMVRDNNKHATGGEWNDNKSVLVVGNSHYGGH